MEKQLMSYNDAKGYILLMAVCVCIGRERNLMVLSYFNYL